MVVIIAFSMPKLVSKIAITGVMEFVVQEALLITSPAVSILSSLTPSTIVSASSPLAGALMMTFLAPASMWALALAGSVNRPVDSITTATPRSFHGSLAGSFSDKTLIG